MIEPMGANAEPRKPRRLIRGDMAAGAAAIILLRLHRDHTLAAAASLGHLDEPEDVHRMRVATRRLRSAIRAFSVVLEPQIVGLEEELKWIFDVLGKVRDLDVQIESIQRLSKRKESESLLRHLELRRSRAGETLLTAVHSDRFGHLRQNLMKIEGFLPIAQMPVLVLAAESIRDRYKAFIRAGEKLSEESKPSDFHKLRRRGKQLRYTLELFQDLYGKRCAELIGDLSRLQDMAGTHNDALVLRRTLKGLSEDPSVGEDGREEAKRIREEVRRDAHGSLDGFGEAFDKVAHDGWRKLRNRMAKRRRAALTG
jgi:CHAD domain-containing protein